MAKLTQIDVTSSSPYIYTLTPFENMIAGGTAGVLARSAVAPLDVLKIRFQLQTVAGKYYRSIPHALYRIGKEEGIRALWKGNFVGCIMSSPYTAIAFSSQKFIKATCFNGNNDPMSNAIAGACAGLLATSATYPLDLIRSRFIAQHSNHGYTSLYSAVSKIYSQGGLPGLFEGITPGLAGIIPYMAVQFALYEGLKSAILDHLPQIDTTMSKNVDFIYSTCQSIGMDVHTIEKINSRIGLSTWKKSSHEPSSSHTNTTNTSTDSHSTMLHTIPPTPHKHLISQSSSPPQTIPLWIIPFVGFISGSVGKAISFPFDLIKRRMQMKSFEYTIDPHARPPSPISSSSTLSSTISSPSTTKPTILSLGKYIYRTEGGVRALYKGIIPAVLKSGPSASLSFFFYETLVKLLTRLHHSTHPKQQHVI